MNFAASAILSFLLAWTTVSAQRACNNSPNLCSKPYDAVTHLGAHDSPFVRDAGSDYTSFGNQFFNTTVQLDAGIRLLTAQFHVASNHQGQRELHLCHTLCSLFDIGWLRDWLWQVRTWMDNHPNDVVTLVLINSGGVTAAELEGEFSAADLAHYAYIPPNVTAPPPPSNGSVSSWPTLDTMIDSGQRLVSFVQSVVPDPANAPYLLNEYTFAWETAYNVADPANFTCDPDRPTGLSMESAYQSGRLFFLNHLLYWDVAFGIQIPDVRTINTTNAWRGVGALGQHLLQCSNAMWRQPTFVLVDFFNVGPAIDAVDIFNQVLQPVGRTNVTNAVMDAGVSVPETVASGNALQASRVLFGLSFLAAPALALVL